MELQIIATERDFTLKEESLIQGYGLFAKKTIPKGTRILEYQGQRIPKANLINDLTQGLSSLRYVMNLDNNTAIDGERNGNDARFINHSCSPNCIVYFFDGTPYIYSLGIINIGEELSFDYQLGTEMAAEQLSIAEKQILMPCHCGSSNCRGTLLSL